MDGLSAFLRLDPSKAYGPSAIGIQQTGAPVRRKEEVAMQVSGRSKIGSVLAAFENNISKNEEQKTTSPSRFLTNIAGKSRFQSPVKTHKQKHSLPRDESNDSMPCVPVLNCETGCKIINSPADSSNSTASTDSASSQESPVAEKAEYKKDAKATATRKNIANDSLSIALPRRGSESTKVLLHASMQATRRNSMDGSETSQSPSHASVSSVGLNANARRILPGGMEKKLSMRDLIKKELLSCQVPPPPCSDLPPTPTFSPVARARQRAIRKTITAGLKHFPSPTVDEHSVPKQPRRSISDPEMLVAHTYELDLQHQHQMIPSPSKKRGKRVLKSHAKATEFALPPEKLQKLINRARQYNPASHGLKGVLKWSSTKPAKNMRVRFTDDIIRSNRRKSLEAATGDKDTPLKQPRRRSMSDVDNLHMIIPPALFQNSPKRRAITLFRAAFISSITLKRIQLRKARAATAIQSLMRGVFQRYRYHIMTLQHKLRETELGRIRDLKDIADQKVRRMEEILYDSESQYRMEEEMALKAKELIAYLRCENVKISAQNKKISVFTNDLNRMNQECIQSTRILFFNYESMDEAVKLLAAHNLKLARISNKFESRLEQIQLELAEVNERLAHERKARSIMEIAVNEIEELAMSSRDKSNNALLHQEIVSVRASLTKQLREKEGMEGSTKNDYDSDDDDNDDQSLQNSKASIFILSTFEKLGCPLDENSFGDCTLEDDDKTFCTMDTCGSGWSSQ
jgi:hypothetical protein